MSHTPCLPYGSFLPRPDTLLRSLALLGCLATMGTAQVCTQIENTVPGAQIWMNYTEVRLRLPFAFPFLGVQHDMLTVSPSGWVKFGSHTTPEPYGTEAQMLQLEPRIALCWEDWDLYPWSNTTGGLYYHATSTAVHLVWKDVVHNSFGTPRFANMELVLGSSGRIDMHYLPTHSPAPFPAIVGISAGNGATANPLDLSAHAAANGLIANATGYEVLPANSFDLARSTITFVPTSATGYAMSVTTPSTCPQTPPPPLPDLRARVVEFGGGCPAAITGSWYEQFDQLMFDLSDTSWHFLPVGGDDFLVNTGAGFDSSYTAADLVPMGDDTVATLATSAMGGFPFGGATLPSVDVCSNGFVWLGSNPSNDYECSPTKLATLGARLAPCWSDWNFAQGGSFYWTATPNYCLATWENVRAWNGSRRNSFQCKLYPSGEFEFSYREVTNNAFYNVGRALVGISTGTSSGAAAPVDIGASVTHVAHLVPFQGPVAPMAHVATDPVLGRTYTITTSNLPAGTVFGMHAIGFTPTSVDLTSIGAPGCLRSVDPITTLLVATTGAPFATSVQLPTGAWLAGVHLVSQGVAYAPGVNSLGFTSSNGILARIGY